MQAVEKVLELREWIQNVRKEGKSIGFVPTMGYLHEGHASLMDRAKQENDVVVASIFVNPIQFGPNEDFDRYPRDMERDMKIASEHQVDLIFHPSVLEMYPKPIQTLVKVSGLTEGLCGASRPGHFDGVATVVLKLLNLVAPDRIYMGKKDYQQVAVIKNMVQDLNVPVEIVPCEIVREPDGLAKSSRNIYLSPHERESALVLNRSLRTIESLVKEGERDVNRLKQELVKLISQEEFARIDYIEIVDADTLMETTQSDRVVAAVAVIFGKTRLIDNLVLESDGRKFYV